MSMPESRTLRFPNGSTIEPSEIWRVNVYPDRSLSRQIPYVKVFDRNGLFYEGLVNLNRIDADTAECLHAARKVTPDSPMTYQVWSPLSNFQNFGPRLFTNTIEHPSVSHLRLPSPFPRRCNKTRQDAQLTAWQVDTSVPTDFPRAHVCTADMRSMISKLSWPMTRLHRSGLIERAVKVNTLHSKPFRLR
jgi:hypothetical protein